MAEISLNLDTTKTNIPNPTVVLRQGDSQYQSIRVTVSDNYTPVDITNAVITFMGTTPADTKIVDTNVSKASDTGVFDYTFPSQAGSTAGTFANAYFKISDGDKLGSTASFTIQVLDSIDMTQAEASDYVSVVDGVIKTTVDQVTSDIQTATSQLSDKVTQANSAIDAKVAGVGAQIDSQVATATDKLNQTIATGNYASQDYVQQTVTSGINAIQKVANASHADVADLAKSLDENGVYKVNTLQTIGNTYLANANTWGLINHGKAIFDDLNVNGQLLVSSGQDQHYISGTDPQGMKVELRRIGNWVYGYFSGTPSNLAAWSWVANVPNGYKPVATSKFLLEVSGQKIIPLNITTGGRVATSSIGADGGTSVEGSTVYMTADDMPG